MSEAELALVVEIIVLAACLGFSFFFVFKMMPRIFNAAFGLGGTRGNWTRLAESWRTSAPPPARLLRRQSVRVGVIIYRRSTTIGASDDGLFLETSGISRLFGLPPVLVPWSAIVDHQTTRLYSMPAVKLTVASPAETTIVFYKSVFTKLGMPIEKGDRP